MAETVEYRPVSGLAVAALVVSVAASLAVVTRFAWALPLVGAGLAAAALADIARPGAAKAGRFAALAALALSLGFGAQAVVGELVDRWITGSRAAAAAGVWVDAVREGRPADALAVSASSALAGIPTDHAAEHGHVTDTPSLVGFQELPTVKAVAACGGTRPAISAVAPIGQSGGWLVRVAVGTCGGGATAVELVAAPRLSRAPGGTIERWMITGLELVQ